MIRRLSLATIALLLLGSIQVGAVSAAPTVSITNVSANKTVVRGGESLRVTWNLSSESITADVAASAIATLKPVSGVICIPSCPMGRAKLVSGTVSSGLWEAYIAIPREIMLTDYEASVSIPGVTPVGGATKSATTIRISDQPTAADQVTTTPSYAGTGWAPSVGPISRTRDGFTFKILNFNSNYSWSYSVSNGIAGIDGEGNFAVKGLKPGEVIIVTLQTTSNTNVVTTATFSERAMDGDPIPLQFQITKQLRNGFTFRITNYNYLNHYTFTLSSGVLTPRGYSGSNGDFEVGEIFESTTVTIDVLINASGYLEGYGQIIAASLPIATPTPVVTPTPSPTPAATPTPAPTATSMPTATPTSIATPSPSPTTTPAKITITCSKGKLVKKVTDSKPLCPKGYKRLKP